MYEDMMSQGKLVLAKDQVFTLDCDKTRVNNNVLVIGGSGTGKTTAIASPNIRQASGSYIILDPKDLLYTTHKSNLEAQGYNVRKLNFANLNDPESCQWNMFQYIMSDEDILNLAHMIIYASPGSRIRASDPFWNDSSELLLISIMAFLFHYTPYENHTLSSILKMLREFEISENDILEKTVLDILFQEVESKDPESFAVKSYKGFRCGTAKTLKSVLITLQSILGKYDTDSINRLTATDTICFSRVGIEKTAVFITISDSNRSLDSLVTIAISQAINELYLLANNCIGGRLPVQTMLILDDFATNMSLVGFPQLISSMRSRGISAIVMIQSEAQLLSLYGVDARTIEASCDNTVYLGGNDLDTANMIARRAGMNLSDVLQIQPGQCIVLRRGLKPVVAQTNLPIY